MNQISDQPLTLLIKLTDEQRLQILERTGRNLGTVPLQSRAASIRCTFAGIELRVSRGVFVPAYTTERLLEIVLGAARQFRNPTIVEVGTGSGALALAIAAALPDSLIYATELSELALRCARANRSRLGSRNVRLRKGSLLEPIPARLRKQVGVIVANLPYVPPSYAEAFAPYYSAGTAIGPGEDGLGLVRQLAEGAREFLMPGGSLVLQLASFQWPAFTTELVSLGYSQPELATELTEEVAPVAGRVMLAD